MSSAPAPTSSGVECAAASSCSCPGDLSWVSRIETVDAADGGLVAGFAGSPRWRLLHAGLGPSGQTALTFAFPDPDAPECGCYFVGADPSCAACADTFEPGR